MDYTKLLNKISINRQPQMIVELTKLVTNPDETIYLNNGMPNPAIFPFVKTTFKIEDGTEFVVEV